VNRAAPEKSQGRPDQGRSDSPHRPVHQHPSLRLAPPRSPDPAYIISVPVTLVAGVPALPLLVALPVLVVGAVVPVALVAAFTVVPVVVVAAAPVPVAAPPLIPPLAGTPVIIRERRGLGLSHAGGSQTDEP
jgi:hypothetical protein